MSSTDNRTTELRIGNEVLVHGYIDEIRKDTVIIRNDGGYFGTAIDEVQAIAATLGTPERTCRMEYQTEGMQRGWWRCSECGVAMDTIEACGGRKPPKWCGNCGARVVDA